MLALADVPLWLHVVGTVGSVLLLAAYLLSGKPANVPPYVHWLNLIGAGAVGALCIVTHAWAAAGLEAAWAAIALVRILR